MAWERCLARVSDPDATLWFFLLLFFFFFFLSRFSFLHLRSCVYPYNTCPCEELNSEEHAPPGGLISQQTVNGGRHGTTVGPRAHEAAIASESERSMRKLEVSGPAVRSDLEAGERASIGASTLSRAQLAVMLSSSSRYLREEPHLGLSERPYVCLIVRSAGPVQCHAGNTWCGLDNKDHSLEAPRCSFPK